jgi:hypothetical protein
MGSLFSMCRHPLQLGRCAHCDQAGHTSVCVICSRAGDDWAQAHAVMSMLPHPSQEALTEGAVVLSARCPICNRRLVPDPTGQWCSRAGCWTGAATEEIR